MRVNAKSDTLTHIKGTVRNGDSTPQCGIFIESVILTYSKRTSFHIYNLVCCTSVVDLEVIVQNYNHF
jgi:hypothetical protein